MAQNLALNIAEKGFPIAVYNRSFDKTEAAERRAQKSGESEFALATVDNMELSEQECCHAGLGEKLKGYKEVKDFVMSLERPRWGTDGPCNGR
jgi:6-phosphogluconate dehydrogenase